MSHNNERIPEILNKMLPEFNHALNKSVKAKAVVFNSDVTILK